MSDRHWTPGKIRVVTAAFLLCAALHFILQSVFRPLWFDEALSVMEFAMRPSIARIWLDYPIPNNHILFNLALRFFTDAQALVMPVSDLSFRLPSVLAALAAAPFLFMLWARRFGTAAALMIMLCLAGSVPFAVYATAVRGYFFGFVFTALAFECAARAFLRGRKYLWVGLFFLCSLAGVGVTPPNILSLWAAALLAAPAAGFWRGGRFKTLAALMAAPPVALALFYLPVAGQLIKAMSLGEGWRDKTAALMTVYGSFAWVFLPVIPLAAAGTVLAFGNKRFRGVVIKGALILLLPAPVILFLSPAPFPRVFFPLWPLWMIICGYAVGLLLRRLFKRPVSELILAAAAGLFLLFVWPAAERASAGFLSGRLTEKGALDDYFKPYYMSGFRPAETIAETAKIIGEPGVGAVPVYLTFAADHYSLLFYGKLKNLPEDIWVFDRPRKKAEAVRGAAFSLIICASESEAEETARRFDLGAPRLIFDNGLQKIFGSGKDPAQQRAQKNH
jgi:hypothetical protein